MDQIVQFANERLRLTQGREMFAASEVQDMLLDLLSLTQTVETVEPSLEPV